jgi:hypothetical protein
VTRKLIKRRHCGRDAGKETMRHDGTICKEEVQCHVFWKTMKKSRLESNRDEWTRLESNREDDIEEMKK